MKQRLRCVIAVALSFSFRRFTHRKSRALVSPRTDVGHMRRPLAAWFMASSATCG